MSILSELGSWLGCDRGITHVEFVSMVPLGGWACGKPSIGLSAPGWPEEPFPAYEPGAKPLKGAAHGR